MDSAISRPVSQEMLKRDLQVNGGKCLTATYVLRVKKHHKCTTVLLFLGSQEQTCTHQDGELTPGGQKKERDANRV